MNFIKQALIGIAIYEAVRLITRRAFTVYHADELPRSFVTEPGADPEATLSGLQHPSETDPWQNSLADDQLRAPDA